MIDDDALAWARGVAKRLRLERQALWSRWLDEHFGPGGEGLDLARGDDREALAALLARAVKTTPERDGQGRWTGDDDGGE
jgi:hypothetical protein